MEKTVVIGDKTYRMRASALIPRLYRAKFGRDLITDMRQIQSKFAKISAFAESASGQDPKDAQLSVLDLTIFEDVAWLMIRHAGEDIPDTPEDWLDSMDGIFSIYEVLPVILSMWSSNQKTTSVAKKK